MVIKQSKRNVVSRLFNAKDDKDTIAAWRLDLNRILQVFNVRSITSSPPLLTICFQTELAINTHIAVSNIGHEVADTRNIVSDVHQHVASTQNIVSDVYQNVASTHNIVSDIHRTMVKQQGADGSSPSVSDC